MDRISKVNDKKFMFTFEEFLNKIDNMEYIEIPENYIMVDNGYSKKKTKVKKSE